MSYLRKNRTTLLFLIVFMALRASLADHYRVPSGSMEPSIEVGDHIGVLKAAYGLRVPLTEKYLTYWDSPEPGEVIVFKQPKTGTIMVKRVVAGPGQRVEFREGQLFVDGKRFSQSHDLKIGPRIEKHQMGEKVFAVKRLGWKVAQPPRYESLVVPKGQYFVMGDNRDNSLDSRYWGLLPKNKILGRAEMVAFSVTLNNGVKTSRIGKRL